MLYATINPEFMEIVGVDALPPEFNDFIYEVGRVEGTPPTHVLRASGTGTVYAYADSFEVLQEVQEKLKVLFAEYDEKP